MSISEVGVPQIYERSITLIAGASVPAASDTFDGSCRVLSIVRTALAGTAGVPAAAVVGPSAAGVTACQWKLGVYSSSATDTSTYLVTWARFYTPSASFAQGGTVAVAAVAAAGQQYAP